MLAPDVLAGLCQRFRVRELDLFGSAIGEAFDPERSDLDFLVLFDKMPRGAYEGAYFGLQEELARLFGRPVDLVTEPALENPYFRRRVEAQRRRLYPLA